ncbi:hypothetical protein JVU11DRAFT_8642 [Chiua virens]|nr:hypothetical protein JVU11DRAFT_8642 [Chiua virens]
MAYSSTLPFELNDDLWFDDGDILVCARRSDSGALCLYKLYRDMLAVHSTSLLNILDKSLARRPVHVGHMSYAYLSDDHALDLERFFIAIHYPIYFLLWKRNARNFRHALPVLRIALKYQATDIIDALASQLEQDWPMTISEWDASQCEVGSGFEPW